MTDEEVQHVRRLLDVTQARRDELEIQAARFGPYRVPAEVAIELRETEESIARLEAKLRIVTVPLIIQDATGPEASIDVLRLNVKELKDQVGTIYRYIEKALIEIREEARDYRAKKDREHRRGAWIYRTLFVLIFIILAWLVFHRGG